MVKIRQKCGLCCQIICGYVSPNIYQRRALPLVSFDSIAGCSSSGTVFGLNVEAAHEHEVLLGGRAICRVYVDRQQAIILLATILRQAERQVDGGLAEAPEDGRAVRHRYAAAVTIFILCDHLALNVELDGDKQALGLLVGGTCHRELVLLRQVGRAADLLVDHQVVDGAW